MRATTWRHKNKGMMSLSHQRADYFPHERITAGPSLPPFRSKRVACAHALRARVWRLTTTRKFFHAGASGSTRARSTARPMLPEKKRASERASEHNREGLNLFDEIYHPVSKVSRQDVDQPRVEQGRPKREPAGKLTSSTVSPSPEVIAGAHHLYLPAILALWRAVLWKPARLACAPDSGKMQPESAKSQRAEPPRRRGR